MRTVSPRLPGVGSLRRAAKCRSTRIWTCVNNASAGISGVSRASKVIAASRQAITALIVTARRRLRLSRRGPAGQEHAAPVLLHGIAVRIEVGPDGVPLRRRLGAGGHRDQPQLSALPRDSRGRQSCIRNTIRWTDPAAEHTTYPGRTRIRVPEPHDRNPAHGRCVRRPANAARRKRYGRRKGSADSSPTSKTAVTKQISTCVEMLEWAVCTESPLEPAVWGEDSGGLMLIRSDADWILEPVGSWREPGSPSRSHYLCAAEHHGSIDSALEETAKETTSGCPSDPSESAPVDSSRVELGDSGLGDRFKTEGPYPGSSTDTWTCEERS